MDLKQCRLLVTPTSYGITDHHLKINLQAQVGEVIYNTSGKPLTSAEVANLLQGIDGYIAGLDVIDRSAIEKADRLKVIARYGVGLNNVDLVAAEEKGIRVTYTPGVNSSSVAELALGLLLSLARQIPEASQQIQQGKWPRFSGISLEGKTIGIIGLGAIGKQFARRLAGFDCHILAFDPYADMKFATEHGVTLVQHMDELIKESDFISLHVPLLPETKGMVNAEFLTKMKPGSFLINTSRGDVIVEADLLHALQNGHIKGAGLDTFAVEPPDPNNPLLHLPQVIATPHLGSHTDGATSKMGWLAMQDCLAVLRGEEPKYPVPQS